MTKQKFSTWALAALVALLPLACDDNPTGDDAGSVSMLITDAPGDFARAIVTIERIELLREGGDDDDDIADDDGRIVLRDLPWTGDLLELSNDVDEIVEETMVPGGDYSEVRFIISGGCIEVENDDETTTVYASDGYLECGAADGDLQMPSLGQSGLKVKLPADFSIDGEHRIVLIDFDVSESFGHQAGNSGKWVMHPVVHATDVVLSGALEVAVTVADSVELPGALTADSFAVRLDDDPAVAVVDGVATFGFLVPGTYSIDLVAPDSIVVTTDPELPVEVEVGSSDDEDLSITITSVL